MFVQTAVTHRQLGHRVQTQYQQNKRVVNYKASNMGVTAEISETGIVHKGVRKIC